MTRYQSYFTKLAILSVLLRVLVPSGYMPASVASTGWFLKLCHHGLSAHAAKVLLGDHHHHGHDHHSTQSIDQCDLGSGFSGSAIPSDTALIVSTLYSQVRYLGAVLSSFSRSSSRGYNPRAPPQLFT